MAREDRAGFLDAECGGDAELRARIEELLKAHDSAGDFMGSPVIPPPEGEPAKPRPPIAEAKGTRIGRYKLLQKIGEGGCGVVWMAEQEKPVRRQVALKIIKLGMDTNEVIARFDAERQALAMMDHPNIAKILDAGATEAGRPYFVMELVRGIRITEFCDRHNLGTDARLKLFCQVCNAVQHAHQKGIIHRDLKPSNILVTLSESEPVPKVIDFGIAKATNGRLTDRTLFTAFEQFIGTPSYMSPEQAELSEVNVDTRSDVYSLGVLLYELLTGRLPFDPKTLLRAGLDEIRRIIREVDPPRPSTNLSTLGDSDRIQVAKLRNTDPAKLSLLLRGDLDWIVMRCLEKNRARRYATVNALAADIARHLNNEPVVARPASRLYRLNRLIRRNRLAFAAVLTVACALIAGTVISSLQAVRARRAERAAEVERLAAIGARLRAEDLLKFMLGDLYTQLDKVGKLELLDSVANKASGYFASLNPGDLDDTTEFSRARAQRLLAGVRYSQGRYAEAAKAIAEAYARISDLALRHPWDGEILLERGQAEYVTGNIFWQDDDLNAASEWMTRYRNTAATLVSLDPTRAEWQLELADGQYNLAQLHQQRGDLSVARSEYLADLVTVGKLLASDPGNTAFLARDAQARGTLGDLSDLQGDYGDALKQYGKQAAQLSDLVHLDPKNASRKQDLAVAHLNVMSEEMTTGRYKEASSSLSEAQQLLTELTAVDDEDVGLKNFSNIGRLAAVTLALQRGDLGEAGRIVDAALPRIEAVAAIAPDDRMCAKLLTRVWRQRALLQSSGDGAIARAAAAKSVELGERLVATKGFTDAEAGECAEDHIVAGNLFEKAGDVDRARQQWQRAEEILVPRIRGSRNWRVLDPYARVSAYLGHLAEARKTILDLNLLGYVPVEPWPDLGATGTAKSQETTAK